jgi:ABC-2 type transport system permease protein
MSLSRSLRAFPTLLKVGFSESVAYRAEMLVWVLSTTMPLIMLALWTAVARDAPVGRYGQAQFTAYFLATFIVRQLTGSWVAWQIGFEVRQGTLAMRLLRPMHPLWSYAAENLAAVPLRLVVALPVAAVMLVVVGRSEVTGDGGMWALWAVAMAGAWLITFLINFVIGCLALYLESSFKLMDVYLALYFVFSGYLFPVSLFPKGMRAVTAFLPFRYQIGLPVEIMTKSYALPEAVRMLSYQWAYVMVLAAVSWVSWRSGLRRFAAYGG